MLEVQRCSGVHCGLGVNYYHQGMIEEAIYAYREMLKDPITRCHIVYSWLGTAYFHKNMLREAS